MAVKAMAPELGEDVKVLGIRQGHRIRLTVASAFIARHVSGMAHYLERKERARLLALAAVPPEAGPVAAAELNVGDDPAAGSVYLTVTGTSAEAGDDGQTGRGNRANGLITPYRAMVLESLAGKNPVTHAGKLYQVAAPRIARTLVAEVEGVEAAECYLASSIGRAITEPRIVDVHLRLGRGVRVSLVEPPVTAIVRRELDRLPDLWREQVERGPTLQ
jgi:S-adenosylmethionine synthetase